MPLKVKTAVRKSKGFSGGVGTIETKKSNADDEYRGEAKVARKKSKDVGVRTLEPKNRLDKKLQRRGNDNGADSYVKSKGSSDGVRTLEPDRRRSDGVRALDTNRRPRNRVPSRGNDNGADSYVKPKRSSDGARTLEPKKRLSKRLQSRGNDNGAASSVPLNEKVRTLRSRGNSSLKTEGGNEGFQAETDGNFGRKRKRIYADTGAVENGSHGGNVKKFDKKFISKAHENGVGWNLDKGKRGKARTFEDSGKNKLLTGNRKFQGTESFDKKYIKGKMESADKLKHVQKPPFATKTYLNERKYVTDSVEKSRKNRVQRKKGLATDSELTEDPPKKKKRGIRIDPHDTSNKRINDDAATNGNGQEKKDLAEKTDVEMSKNAQFRAIRPSPSILSFVEDNLLGRRREIEFRNAGYNIELSAPLDNIPFSTSSERERIEVPVFRNKLEFFAAAKISSSFPAPDLPEIAFAGRSNVGKSSLLNSLTRQWGVVRTSDKPGLTQTINFFKLEPKLSLVDLPGYGFAYAKEEVKEAWEELVKEYVASRDGLKRVMLLVDTKWGLKPRDLELINLMERSQTRYQIVLTKTDLVFPIDVARRAMQIEENLKAKKSAVQPLMMVSSKTGAGIRSLRTVLAKIARLAKR